MNILVPLIERAVKVTPFLAKRKRKKGAEKMKLNFKDVVVPAAILCLICIIVSAPLGVTNQLTADKIWRFRPKRQTLNPA